MEEPATSPHPAADDRATRIAITKPNTMNEWYLIRSATALSTDGGRRCRRRRLEENLAESGTPVQFRAP